MNTEQEVRAILERVGAFMEGHIVLTSGRHTSVYVDKRELYRYKEETSFVCNLIAGRFMDHDIEAVIAPAEGARILSYHIARHLGVLDERNIPGLCAEKGKEPGTFFIRSEDISLIAGKHVLVVEDVTTTGGSVRKVVELVRAHGGNVTGVGVLCNRGGVTEYDVGDVPQLFALTHIPLESWDENDCLLCRNGMPINIDVGKGKEYLARKLNPRGTSAS